MLIPNGHFLLLLDIKCSTLVFYLFGFLLFFLNLKFIENATHILCVCHWGRLALTTAVIEADRHLLPLPPVTTGGVAWTGTEILTVASEKSTCNHDIFIFLHAEEKQSNKFSHKFPDLHMFNDRLQQCSKILAWYGVPYVTGHWTETEITLGNH